MVGPQNNDVSRSEAIKALLDNQKEENAFVRHYEETRFKITQITITLSGLLIGALRFGESEPRTSQLVGLFIVVLGVLGALISAKYTERADRHAKLSRAYRRAVSGLIGAVGALSDLEAVHSKAVATHELGRGLHNVRARLFWIGIHICMIVLGLVVAFLWSR